MAAVGGDQVRFVFCDRCEWNTAGVWDDGEAATVLTEHRESMHAGEEGEPDELT